MLFFLKYKTKLTYGVFISLLLQKVQSSFDFKSDKNINNIFHLPNKMGKSEMLHNIGLFILNNMKPSIDPCDDFYEYACGNWAHNQKVPEVGRHLTFIQTMNNELQDLAIRFLEDKANYAQSVEKAKLFFTSCVTTERSVKKGLAYLMQEETEIFKKVTFSEKDGWLDVNFMSPYGIYPLLPLSVKAAKSLSGSYEVYLDTPQPYLSQFAYISSRKETFLKYTEINSKDFEEILKFERRLTREATKRNLTERATLNQFLLHHKNDPLDWDLVFQKVFSSHTKNFWYINNQIEDIAQLQSFLRITPIATLRSYVKYCTIVKFFAIWMNRSDKLGTLRHQCLDLTEKYFRYALMSWFQKHFYSEENHEGISKMAHYLKEYFFNSVKHYDWLSMETKLNVQQKLWDMNLIAGYPKQDFSNTIRMQRYDDMQISSNWFTNLQNLEAHFTRVLFQSVHQELPSPVLSPFSANGFYNNILNIVFLSMGLSQVPLYHQDLPVALKFAGVGIVIAHEIAHGFDSESFQHDFSSKGFKYSDKWLSYQSLKNFKSRWLCLKNQYETFNYLGKRIKSSLSMPENVADNAMLHLSYDTYTNLFGWKENVSKPLKDLNFTNDQLFFIKFSQTFCKGDEVTDGKKSRRAIPKDEKHVYEQFRVLLPLQNMPAFSKSFNCKLGSPMNPVKKCRLW